MNAKSRTGAEELATPREIIRDFLTVLNIMKDNPEADFDTVVGNLAPQSPLGNDDGIEPDISQTYSKKPIGLFDIDI